MLTLHMRGLRKTVAAFARGMAFVCVLVSVAACSKSSDDPSNGDTSAPRTVVVYMVAENSLATNAALDVREMLLGVRHMSDNDRLVVYLDDEQMPRIYVLTNRTSATSFASLVPDYTYDADQNSATASTLSGVLRYARTRCPAQEYGLVLWSHGSGWIPSTFKPQASARRFGQPLASFGIDNGENTRSNQGAEMDIADLARTLSDFGRLEFILFDACFMQTIETAYELRSCAKHILASPAEIQADGAPYEALLRPMFATPIDVTAMSTVYCDHYASSASGGALLSVIDCGRLDGFAQTMRALVATHRDALLAIDGDGLLNYFDYDTFRRRVFRPDFYDMRGLMRRVLTSAEFQQWEAELDQLVVARPATDTWMSAFSPDGRGMFHTVDFEQYSGVSMFVPLPKYAANGDTFSADYLSTAWARDVWSE